MAGCLTTITKRASAKAPWRKRVMSRLGGDFSTRTGLARSQWGRHRSSRRVAVWGEQRRALGEVGGRVEREPAGAAGPRAGG